MIFQQTLIFTTVGVLLFTCMAASLDPSHHHIESPRERERERERERFWTYGQPEPQEKVRKEVRGEKSWNPRTLIRKPNVQAGLVIKDPQKEGNADKTTKKVSFCPSLISKGMCNYYFISLNTTHLGVETGFQGRKYSWTTTNSYQLSLACSAATVFYNATTKRRDLFLGE